MTRKREKYKEIGEREVNYSEKEIQNKIIKDLKDRGYWVMKTQGGVAGTPIGAPDIIACYKGEFLGIEVKKIGGKVSESQLIQATKIGSNDGNIYFTNDIYFDIDRPYELARVSDMNFKKTSTYYISKGFLYECI